MVLGTTITSSTSTASMFLVDKGKSGHALLRCIDAVCLLEKGVYPLEAVDSLAGGCLLI